MRSYEVGGRNSGCDLASRWVSVASLNAMRKSRLASSGEKTSILPLEF
jgi:hypothetical protein